MLETTNLYKLIDELSIYTRLVETTKSAGIKSLQKLRLDFISKLIKIGSFERRRQGLVELIKLLDDAYKAESQSYMNTIYQNQDEESFKLDELIEWIKYQKLIRNIFKDSPHIELIRKSQHVLKIMAKKEVLSQDEISYLWAATVPSDSNMEISDAALDAVKEVTSVLPQQ